MSSAVNPRRPARGSYRPRPETLAKLRVSGNPINGLGESSVRRPSPFFWHPPDKHPWGELQIVARESSRVCPGSQEAFQRAYEYLTLLSVAGERKIRLAAEWTDAVRKFALEHEADATGIAAMDPLWVFEGYSIEEPWIIILALAHNYERLKEVPSDETNGVGVCDIGDQYARGTRASYALANWIRSQGYTANPYPGPGASAVALIPPAIAAGRCCLRNGLGGNRRWIFQTMAVLLGLVPEARFCAQAVELAVMRTPNPFGAVAAAPQLVAVVFAVCGMTCVDGQHRALPLQTGFCSIRPNGSNPTGYCTKYCTKIGPVFSPKMQVVRNKRLVCGGGGGSRTHLPLMESASYRFYLLLDLVDFQDLQGRSTN